MGEVSLRIDGMHCGACIRRVTQSLQAVPGARVDEVRLGAARVHLDKGDHVESDNAGALIASLAKAGFAAQIET